MTTAKSVIDNANQVLCVRAISEYHEPSGGNGNVYHPALRFDLVRGSVVDPHYCQDIKNAPAFDNEPEAIQYAVTWLVNHPYFAIDAAMTVNA